MMTKGGEKILRRHDHARGRAVARLVRLSLALAAGTTLGGLLLFVYFAKDLPDPSRLDRIDLSQSTKIYDREGVMVLYDVYGEVRRNVVPFNDFPQYLVYATVAIEDERFYSHPGFDIEGILRAAVHNVFDRGSAQGGSTISQQFIKNTVLTPERTVTRKIKEWILATELERRYSKDEIMNLYLNHVPYGSVAYGAETASQIYFGKPVKNISLAEAATLAALTKAPTYYSPYGSNPERLEERKDLVLEKMANLGFITQEERQNAQNEEVEFAQNIQKIQAPHFVMLVREYLERAYGKEMVEKGGLRVTTTLDFELQKFAEEAVAEYHETNKKRFGSTNAALVAIDPQTGQILAMVGSADYYDIENDGNVNVVTRERQPGSSFKPLAYAAAFEKGYTPQTILFDVPTEFSEPGAKSYQPQNYDGLFRGPVKMEEALAQSLNIPSVKTLYLAGVEETTELARKMGITTLRDPSRYGLSLVLGGGEVKLLDLTSSFGVFGQEGTRHPVSFISRVETKNGEALEVWEEKKEEVLAPNTARMINDILSRDDLRAPIFGSSSSLVVPGYEVAVKTGTTQEYRDAWTVGYTPTLAAGVWAGNNDNASMKNNAAGVNVAGPTWNHFMKKALEKFPKKDFKPYEKKDVQKPILNGEFLIKSSILIDSVSGQRATALTPPHLKVSKTIRTIRSILYWVDRNDPQGTVPADPSKDPQFDNWERSVAEWVERSSYFNIIGSEEDADNATNDLRSEDKIPKLSIVKPSSYDMVSGNYLEIELRVSAVLGVSQFDIFWGEKLAGSYFPKNAYQNTYRYQIPLPQETTGRVPLIIRVFDRAENKTEEQTVVLFEGL